MEEKNGREKSEENGNRKEPGNKEENRIEGENPIVVCKRKRKKSIGQWY